MNKPRANDYHTTYFNGNANGQRSDNAREDVRQHKNTTPGADSQGHRDH